MRRSLIASFLLIALLAGSAVNTAPLSYAQDTTAPNAFAEMLASVPDTPDHRAWLTFGDIEAWHTAWKVPRPLNLMTLDLLPRIPRGYWMFVLPRQTTPPASLGMEFLMFDDQRPFYGFDFFNVNRVVSAGGPPDEITLLTHNGDPVTIADTLINSGYTAEELDDGWTLYSILDDAEVALSSELAIPRVGVLGTRNRIALNEQQMIIARATAPVVTVVEAASGAQPTLIDDPVYAALANALSDPLLDGTGTLVGAIAQDGLSYVGIAGAALIGPNMTAEGIEAQREALGLNDPARLLPLFNAVAFATSHAEGASYLILALAFPPGTDTDHAISVLEAKLPQYESLRLRASLADRWSLDRSGSVEVNGIPVALVVMRVENPSSGDDTVQPAVFNWYDLIVARDTLFLATVLEAEGTE